MRSRPSDYSGGGHASNTAVRVGARGKKTDPSQFFLWSMTFHAAGTTHALLTQSKSFKTVYSFGYKVLWIKYNLSLGTLMEFSTSYYAFY